MESPDLFIGLFLTIGLVFGAMALHARGKMRAERRAGATRDLAEIDRRIARLTAEREHLARLANCRV